MKIRTHFNMAKLALNHIKKDREQYKPSLLKRISLYIGSVLPDLNLRQAISHPHFYKKSSKYVFDKITQLKKQKKINMIFMIRLGKIMHYLNDFCCYVHRGNGVGNVKEHVLYERKLNKYLLKNRNMISLKVKDIKIKNKIKDIVYEIEDVLKEYRKSEPSYLLDIKKSINMNLLIYKHILSFENVIDIRSLCKSKSELEYMEA